MQKKIILILFGGISPEHEVSVITGLQVLENIDKSIYKPIPILQEKNGLFKILGSTDPKKFLKTSRRKISFGIDIHGGYVKSQLKKIYPDCAILAFHGGPGECGSIQGLLDSIGIPFTSPSVESSVLASNKAVAKIFAEYIGIPILPFSFISSKDLKNNLEKTTSSILEKMNTPLIVKPVHLGSSIGVEIAKEKEDLIRILSSNSLIDSEILVEEFLKEFTEYNCSVFMDGKDIIVSEIERPLKSGETLTFEDKYERKNASKNNSTGGMVNLSRELPAKINKNLKKEIIQYAKEMYKVLRTEGLVRIDFIQDSNGKIYFNEMNRIPGSLAFYLWESKGLSFTNLLDLMISEAIGRKKRKSSYNFEYETDIVETFINNIDR